VTRRKFNAEGPQILGVAVQNLVATESWRLGFDFRWHHRICLKRLWNSSKAVGQQSHQKASLGDNAFVKKKKKKKKTENAEWPTIFKLCQETQTLTRQKQTIVPVEARKRIRCWNNVQSSGAGIKQWLFPNGASRKQKLRPQNNQPKAFCWTSHTFLFRYVPLFAWLFLCCPAPYLSQFQVTVCIT
jgi:hypothetical protein